MLNPFEETTMELIHISSGVVATSVIATYIQTARYLDGQSAADQFLQKRLQEGEVDIHSPLKLKHLLTW